MLTIVTVDRRPPIDSGRPSTCNPATGLAKSGMLSPGDPIDSGERSHEVGHVVVEALFCASLVTGLSRIGEEHRDDPH